MRKRYKTTTRKKTSPLCHSTLHHDYVQEQTRTHHNTLRTQTRYSSEYQEATQVRPSTNIYLGTWGASSPLLIRQYSGHFTEDSQPVNTLPSWPATHYLPPLLSTRYGYFWSRGKGNTTMVTCGGSARVLELHHAPRRNLERNTCGDQLVMPQGRTPQIGKSV